ncbi:class Ib ribonucleoside-diphosphate reductase assembly flavoprotein NrdI [Microvirga sp. W0021]|uniref:Protein NrdI n=1 Tax=Hohaiivirga grylli TaxID=3133970 RepID=A0ABV0BKH9_9HYPH
MGLIVYFSSSTRNTERFVERLGLPAQRIPVSPDEPMLKASEPYVLFAPTYAGGDGEGAVHKQVIRFLNNTENRSLIRGVISSGNTNFGKYYAVAGDVVAAKCKVPLLYRFELLGTAEDVVNVRSGLERFWLQ